MYRKYPKINADFHCGQNQLCRCFGSEHVTTLENFLIYDLINDPYEDNPLSEDSTK